MRARVHVRTLLMGCCRGDVEEFEVALILSRRGGDCSGYRLRVHCSGVHLSARMFRFILADRCDAKRNAAVGFVRLRSNDAAGLNETAFVKCSII